MINEDLTSENLDTTIDSTILGSQIGNTGENKEIPAFSGSDIHTFFQDCDPPFEEPTGFFENLQGKVIEAGYKTIGFEISDLMGPELAGLKKCLYLIILYMALSIGLWTFQVTLMLNEGVAIIILIFGTILLLIPCIIYWLRYLNRILAQDEDSSTEKSQSDVLSGDDIQDIEMDNWNMAGNAGDFVVDADVEANVERLSHNGVDDYGDQEYSLRRQQRLIQLQQQLQQRLLQEQQQQQNEDEPGIEVDKVSDMPRIIVAGDLPPPPVDYEIDDNVCPFMIGLPKYLEGTQVERDLKKSVETSMAISGLPPKESHQGETNFEVRLSEDET